MDNHIQMQKELSEMLQRKVIDVIEKMAEEGERINFFTVAEKAGVSRVFLYKHDDIRKRIEATRLPKTPKKELEKEVIRLRLALQKERRSK